MAFLRQIGLDVTIIPASNIPQKKPQLALARRNNFASLLKWQNQQLEKDHVSKREEEGFMGKGIVIAATDP